MMAENLQFLRKAAELVFNLKMETVVKASAEFGSGQGGRRERWSWAGRERVSLCPWPRG